MKNLKRLLVLTLLLFSITIFGQIRPVSRGTVLTNSQTFQIDQPVGNKITNTGTNLEYKVILPLTSLDNITTGLLSESLELIDGSGNFVDLTTNQSIDGEKTFNEKVNSLVEFEVTAGSGVASLEATGLSVADPGGSLICFADRLRIYSAGSGGSSSLQMNLSTTGNQNFTLPLTGGTLAKLTDITGGGTVQGTDGNSLNIRAKDDGNGPGNARGEYSVDLQTARLLTTQVAGGQYSVIGGGQYNEVPASNPYVTISGGYDNIGSGDYASIGGGLRNEADGYYSAIPGGVDLKTPSYGEFATGIFNTDYTPISSITYSATDRIFSVGIGQNSGARKNAITILKNGNLGIGTDTPIAKLSVSSDTNYQQFSFENIVGDEIQRLGFTGRTYFESVAEMTMMGSFNDSNKNDLFFGGGSDGFNAASKMSFWTEENYNTGKGTIKMTLSGAGNLGVGVVNPTEKLEVNGNVQAASFIKDGATSDDILLGNGGTTSLSGIGGATEINDLSDATTDSTTLFMSNNAGFNDAGNLTNLGIGESAAFANTTGNNNISIGWRSNFSNVIGRGNLSIGANALYKALGDFNFGFGEAVMYNLINGNRNLGLGTNAGRYTATAGAVTDLDDSIFIGYHSSPLISGGQNEIVIGVSADGHGSNTATLGNNNITRTILKGNVETTALQINTSTPAVVEQVWTATDVDGNGSWQTPSGGGATNLSTTHNATTVVVNSSTGTNATINGATTSLAGIITNGTQEFGGIKTFESKIILNPSGGDNVGIESTSGDKPLDFDTSSGIFWYANAQMQINKTGGDVVLTGTQEATSSTNGALKTAGGLAVAKKIYAGGDITGDSFIKDGATSNDILLGDGTTTSLSGLSSGFIPYTGATSDVNLGTHTIQLGKEEIVTDKAKHELSLLDSNGEPSIRNQTHYWNGSSWSEINGYGFGYLALKNNTGIDCNAFGTEALRNNTGNNSNGFGYLALESNEGVNSSGFGDSALKNNTGVSSNGFGTLTLQNNIGANSSGFGNLTLQNNTGNSSNGFGNNSLQNNTGDSSNGFGNYALWDNKADRSSGFGQETLMHVANTSANLTGIGYRAAQGTVGVPVDFTNSTAIGAYSIITKSNQVTLGDITTTEVLTTGNITMGDILQITPSITPGSAVAGDIYYDLTTDKLRCYNGTIWNDLF